MPAQLTACRIDKAFCKGTIEKPIPGNKFSGLKFANPAIGNQHSVNIKDWIEGIGKTDPSPDRLSDFDKSIDGSIGGFGTTMEKMYNSERSAPLIEFRDLAWTSTTDIEKFMKNVDSAIQQLHKDFANAPTKKRALPAACLKPATVAQSTTTTQGTSPTGKSPPVVAPKNPPSPPRCVPNLVDSVKDAHEGELKKAAKFFCDKHATDTNAKAPIKNEATIIAGTKQVGRNSADVAYVYPEKMGNQDDVYDFSLKSVDNCTPAQGFNLASPVAHSNCVDILHDAWKKCESRSMFSHLLSSGHALMSHSR